jgi:hypothetical protein
MNISDEAIVPFKVFTTPYMQVANGLLPSEVVCNNGLELLQKNGKPACVKSSNVEKFLELGFTKEFSTETKLFN